MTCPSTKSYILASLLIFGGVRTSKEEVILCFLLFSKGLILLVLLFHPNLCCVGNSGSMRGQLAQWFWKRVGKQGCPLGVKYLLDKEMLVAAEICTCVCNQSINGD